MKKENFKKIDDIYTTFAKKSIPKWLESNENSISPSQYHVLRMLLENGPQRVTDLSNELNITLSGVTSLSDKLIKDKYLERKRSEEDRRVVLLCITEKGTETCNRITKIRSEKIEKMHENLTDDEINSLVSIYHKILDNFS